MPHPTKSQTHPDYDLIIIGASFAGLVAARTAAHRGLKVAVVDAKPEPGARVRSTGILVKEAIGEYDVPSALTRKIPGVRMYAPNGAHVDLTAPGYFFSRNRYGGADALACPRGRPSWGDIAVRRTI